MSKKKKVSVRLEAGEAYVIGPIEYFDHMVVVYKTLADRAETEEEKSKWLGTADWVASWADQTVFLGDSEDDW